MNRIDHFAARATAFALAAVVTLSMLLGVDHLALAEHAAQNAQTLVQKAPQPKT